MEAPPLWSMVRISSFDTGTTHPRVHPGSRVQQAPRRAPKAIFSTASPRPTLTLPAAPQPHVLWRQPTTLTSTPRSERKHVFLHSLLCRRPYSLRVATGQEAALAHRSMPRSLTAWRDLTWVLELSTHAGHLHDEPFSCSWQFLATHRAAVPPPPKTLLPLASP